MMRKFVVAFAIACLPAIASAQPAGDGAAAPAPAPAGEKHYTTAETELGTLLDDPASKAVLEKHLPGFASNPQLEQARGFTLKAIQQFAPDAISDQILTAIDADLAKLPAKK